MRSITHEYHKNQKKHTNGTEKRVTEDPNRGKRVPWSGRDRRGAGHKQAAWQAATPRPRTARTQAGRTRLPGRQPNAEKPDPAVAARRRATPHRHTRTANCISLVLAHHTRPPVVAWRSAEPAACTSRDRGHAGRAEVRRYATPGIAGTRAAYSDAMSPFHEPILHDCGKRSATRVSDGAPALTASTHRLHEHQAQIAEPQDVEPYCIPSLTGSRGSR